MHFLSVYRYSELYSQIITCLSHGNDLLSRGNDLLSRGNDFLSRGNDFLFIFTMSSKGLRNLVRCILSFNFGVGSSLSKV